MEIELIEKIEKIRDKTLMDVNTLENTYKWNQKIDMRIRSFSKLIYIEMGLHAAFCYPALNLENDEFWNRVRSKYISTP